MKAFEWDEKKNKINKSKHGISFDEAIFVFFDPYAIYHESVKAEERREVLIGSSEKGVMFVVFV